MSWLSTIAAWLGAERYSQHAICLTNDTVMIILYTASELMIFFSYFWMGGVLAMYYLNIVAISAPTRLLYGAFIILCGLTHLMGTVVLFTGVYRLDIMVNVATAAVSLATAIMTTKEVMGRPEPSRR
jgi:hypothetical protein